MADRSRGDGARPAGDQRNPDPALGQHPFLAFERQIVRVRPPVVGREEHHGVCCDTVRRVSVTVGIVQQLEHSLHVFVDPGDESQILRLPATDGLKRLLQVGPRPHRSVNRIRVKLQVERLAGGVKFADGFFQRIAERIADVFGRANQLGGQGCVA
jgi:hypothetical protein